MSRGLYSAETPFLRGREHYRGVPGGLAEEEKEEEEEVV